MNETTDRELANVKRDSAEYVSSSNDEGMIRQSGYIEISTRMECHLVVLFAGLHRGKIIKLVTPALWLASLKYNTILLYYTITLTPASAGTNFKLNCYNLELLPHNSSW